MTSVVELFPKARKLSYDARSQLRSVENNACPSSSLFFSLDELDRQLNLLEGLIQNEAPSQREIWRRKVNELRVESVDLRTRGNGVSHHRYNEQLNLQNREEVR
jgi:golgi SNAP receptor complex member 2